VTWFRQAESLFLWAIGSSCKLQAASFAAAKRNQLCLGTPQACICDNIHFRAYELAVECGRLNCARLPSERRLFHIALLEPESANPAYSSLKLRTVAAVATDDPWAFEL